MVVLRQVFLAVNVMVYVCPLTSVPDVLTAPVKNYRTVVLYCESATGWKLEEFPRYTLPVSLFQVNFPLGSFIVFVRMSCDRCPTTMLYTGVPDPTLSRRWIVLPELTNHKLLLSGKKPTAMRCSTFIWIPVSSVLHSTETLSNNTNKENKGLVINFYGNFFVFEVCLSWIEKGVPYWYTFFYLLVLCSPFTSLSLMANWALMLVGDETLFVVPNVVVPQENLFWV